MAKVHEWDFRAPRIGEELEFVFTEDRTQWVHGTVQYVDQDARQFEAVQSVCVCGWGVLYAALWVVPASASSPAGV